MEIETAPFYLDTMTDLVLDVAAGSIAAKDVELTLVTGKDVPARLEGDPLRLQQVLLNLVNNAVKFTPKGEIKIDIENVSPAADRVMLNFKVTDTGVGISPEVQKSIFSPFTQADTSTTRKYGGTGLGLAISARLVELMGGRLEVTSDQESGSSFSFTLPCESAHIAAQENAVCWIGYKAVLLDNGSRQSRQAGNYLHAFGFGITRCSSAEHLSSTLQQEQDSISLIVVPDTEFFKDLQEIKRLIISRFSAEQVPFMLCCIPQTEDEVCDFSGYAAIKLPLRAKRFFLEVAYGLKLPEEQIPPRLSRKLGFGQPGTCVYC